MLRRLPFVFFAAMALLLAALLYQESPTGASREGKAFPPLSLEPLPEHSRAEMPSGGVRVVNLFASWCAPCIAEMPLLETLSEREHVQLIGIAWSEKEANLDPFFKKHGNPYDVVLNDADGEVGVALGIRGLPETYVVDDKGTIRYHHAGPLTDDTMATLNATLDELLP